MLTTADGALAARFRLLRQHAMTVSDTIRHESSDVVFEDYLEPAFNYRMTDLQAAVGRPQLARLDAIVAERRRLARRYQDALAESPVLRPPVEEPWGRSNWQSFPVFLRTGSGVSQIAAIRHLMGSGVACKRGISNAHQELAYADRARWACGPEGCPWACPEKTCRRLSQSERLRDETILLPLFHGMTAEEQGRVVEACHELAGAKGVRA
jgi:perosamine synthetase